MTDVDAFLEHYGVKGMKWGVRKERKTERREARAQKFVQKADIMQTRIDQLNVKRVRSTYAKNARDQEVRKLSSARDRALRDAEAKRAGKMSSTQRKVVIGAAVVGAIVAGTVVYKTGQSGELRQRITQGKAFVEGKRGFAVFKRNEALSRKDLGVDELLSNVVRPVNPGFGGVGTKNNCRRATFAYELRRRGFDVSATRSTNGSGQNFGGLLNATRPGMKRIPDSGPGLKRAIARETAAVRTGKKANSPLLDILSRSTPQGATGIDVGNNGGRAAANIFSALSGQPNGARGELGLTWFGGASHSVAWEIVNGSPVVFDTQSGTAYRSAADFISVASQAQAAGFTRLDNIPLSANQLMRWVRNA